MIIRFTASLFICIITIMCLHVEGFSQGVKREVEESISRTEMPEQALSLLKNLLQGARKVHYYRETDGDRTSYECKLLWQGDAYSIEFLENGSLLDIEKLMAYHALPEKVRGNMDDYLSRNFQKFKIKKLQQQFTAEDSDESDQEVIREFIEQDADDLTIKYEIEVNTKKDRKINAYEMLFDKNGNYIKQRIIVRRSLDHILY